MGEDASEEEDKMTEGEVGLVQGVRRWSGTGTGEDSVLTGGDYLWIAFRYGGIERVYIHGHRPER